MEEYLDRIGSDFFEPVSSYKVIDAGWTNLVFEINEGYIFRFVRDTSNTQFALERDFLPKFAQVCPVTIPNIVLSGDDYIAYPKIIGDRFAPERFLQFNCTQKTALIKLLAEFLTCLHNFQFDHQHLSDAPYGGKNFWHDLWVVVEGKLSSQTREKAEKYFTDILQQVNAVSFAKTLVHSDLGTNNILVDFEQSCLNGIIDFGDLCLNDPAADFAGFYRNFGRGFTEKLLYYYQRPTEDNFWARIEYESKRKMFFVVHFALNYGYEVYIPNLMRYIEQLFQKNESNYD
jgi:aminoglycoside 2''-phosphotransferase